MNKRDKTSAKPVEPDKKAGKSRANSLAVVHPPESPNVRTIELDAADVSAIGQLGIVICGGVDDRLNRAATAYNQAARLTVEAGYLLLSVKAEIGHGAFGERVEAMGLSRQRASEMMRMAKLVSSVSDEQRCDLLALPKTKVLALANAEPEVMEALMAEDGPVDLSATNVRELAAKVRELNRALTDTAVQRDAAVNERDAALKRLAKAHRNNRADQVPVVVADLRAEMAVSLQAARAAVESMHPLGLDLVNLSGTEEAHGWIDPTAEIAFAGLVALHVAVKNQLLAFAEAFQITTNDVDALVDPAFGLTDQEVSEVARKWDTAVRHAEYEKALRQWEREQKRPRGKGRPTEKPVPPEQQVG